MIEIPELYDKVWVARLDDRTRHAHREAHGQKVPYSKEFRVGGENLRWPGDPDGTPENTYNCRCHIRIEPRGSLTAGGEQEIRMPETILPYTGEMTTEDFVSKVNGDLALKVSAEHARRVNDGVLLFTKTAEDVAPDVTETYRTFTDQAFAVIGSPTSDGRMLASDIDMSFRSFPLPLMWCEQTGEGHEDAYTIGVIESARVEGGHVVASGYVLNTTDADRWYSIAAHGVSNVSVDLVAGSYRLTDEHGVELDDERLQERFDNDEPILTTFTRAEMIGATFVAKPAFDTRITLNSERESRDVALVAGAVLEFTPRVYDHRLFENPNLSGPTNTTVGENGHVYGHMALFNQPHRSVQHEYIPAPRSPSGYAHFHTSPALLLDDGSHLPVGRLTVGTGHADIRLTGGPALAHYDNTGTCFALVRAYEDAYGIAYSGVIAPWATPEQVEMGVSAPLSCDWRDFGEGRDLIASLAVNTPGYAVLLGRDDDQGRPVALVASLGPPRRRQGNLTRDELKEAVVEALLETAQAQKFEAQRAEALARAAQYTRPPTPREQVAKLLTRIK